MRCGHTALRVVIILCSAAAVHAETWTVTSAEDLIKDWVSTVNMNDPEKLLAFYDESDMTEVIVSSGVRHRGFEALQEAYKDDLEKVRFYDSSAREMGTRILGDTALVTFEHLFKFHVLADDSRWQMHIRTTSVLHQLENEWKIVLEHSSAIRGVEWMTRIED